MGLKFLIFLLITLPIIINGGKTPIIYVEEVRMLDEYANSKTPIADNVLMLSEDGFLGEGGLGFVYAGKLIANDHPVAIKFVPKEDRLGAKYEFKVYKQLDAYQNPQVENCLIPNVFFYGKWGSFILTAITKFDQSLETIQETIPILPLDMMILFRNFVIQSRYMHTHGISHGAVQSDNIMFRLNQSFLIDFNDCHLLENGKTSEPTHEDWQGFIYTVIEHYGISFMGSWDCCKNELRKHNLDKILVRVIKEFGDEAFLSSEDYPNYDRFEEFINKGIIRMHGSSPSPPTFSWLMS